MSDRRTSSRTCVECESERSKSDYAVKKRKDRYSNQKESLLSITKKWREKNKPSIKKRLLDNSERIAIQKKDWYEKNRSRILSDKREKRKTKQYKDSAKAFREKNKAMFACKAIARRMVLAVKQSKNFTPSCEVLGFSSEMLKMRMECQFKGGMSWDNYGEWHIDHKKPVVRFVSQGITNPKIINALSNLQPMWAKENLSKGKKF